MMKAIFLTLAMATIGITAAPMAAASSCPSGDICCETSGVNCTCSTAQDPSTPDTDYDCRDTATGMECESSSGATYLVMVGTNCNLPGLLEKILKIT